MPKNLSHVKWHPRYASSRDDLIRSFYQPALEHACGYARAAGYFRSTLFTLVGSSIAEYALRGGRIRLICSPELTAADAATIRDIGQEAAGTALHREMEEVLSHPMGREPLEIMGALLGIGALEIRLAIADSGRGIFHSKVGVFEDEEGNELSFSGSINESWRGWHPLGNHENFEVFRSWDGDAARVADHRHYFEALWSGTEPGVTVLDAPQAFAADLVNIVPDSPEEKLRARVLRTGEGPGPRRLLDHQAIALSNWRKAGLRGIFVHATGSGKTVTGLHAVRECLMEDRAALILVPSALLVEQWAEEARRELADFDPSILLAGAGNTRWRERSLLAEHLNGGSSARVVIATIATASSSRFLEALDQGNYLMVADEVHRLGAPGGLALLKHAKPTARLGLSATPVRAFDSEGTQALDQFFGGVVPPVVTLTDAIKAGRLCNYEYWPTVVRLTPQEQEAWEKLTKEIQKRYAREVSSDGEIDPSEHLKHLLIRRSRIAKSAKSKVAAAERIAVDHFQAGQRWIFYCDDRQQSTQVLRQLRKVGVPAWEYHSAMQGSRDATLRAFREEGGALVSIRCLDEGVDIPEVTHAAILASSRNYREFIQRRGRVLRTSRNKYFATLFDLLVMPAPGDDIFESLASGELSRAAEFADGAVNRSARATIAALAREHGVDLASSDTLPRDEDLAVI